METTDYCSYELSKALTKIGCWFDTDAVYYKADESLNDYMLTNVCQWEEDEYIPAISLWYAQKWLRENKKMHCQVLLNGVRSMYFWQVRERVGNGRYADSNHQYDLYEDAMSDCIAAALELIKKGG